VQAAASSDSIVETSKIPIGVLFGHELFEFFVVDKILFALAKQLGEDHTYAPLEDRPVSLRHEAAQQRTQGAKRTSDAFKLA
jgi:hypothetical protein